MLSVALKNFIPVDLEEMRYPGFLEKQAKEIKECVDSIAKGKGWKEITKCPLCSCKERKIIFDRFGIKIVQCDSCSVGYSEKFPLDTSAIYSQASYLPVAKNGYIDNDDYRKQRFAKERLELINKYLNTPPEKSRLLDVGCGTGWFLEAAKEASYQVFGQEVGQELAAFTTDRLGIKVWTEAFTQLNITEKFNVITLFDVIEHVPNPREIIKSIESHLHTSGIALIFTPNLDSIAFWKLKEQSSQVAPAGHLFYFTEKSLRKLIDDQPGLKVLSFET